MEGLSKPPLPPSEGESRAFCGRGSFGALTDPPIVSLAKGDKVGQHAGSLAVPNRVVPRSSGQFSAAGFFAASEAG